MHLRLRRQVAFKGLVDGDSVDVGVVNEPDDLIGEQFAVILRWQVGLRRLWGVQLEALPDSLAENVQSRVGLHDLGHGLLDEGLSSREPIAERCVKIVSLEIEEKSDKTRK